MKKTSSTLKKGITVLLVVLMVFSMVPVYSLAAEASDISSHWARKEIQSWIDLGILSGYQDGTFKPDNNITRAEFMSIVNNAFKYTEVSQINFSDVSSDAWYYKTVSKAKAAGYITGYTDGTMKPNNPITREEVASIITKINNLDTNNVSDKAIFSDEATFGWSKNIIKALAESKIMLGYPDGTFKPKNLIKRGEAVFALNSALKYKEKNVVYDKAGTYGPESGILTVEGNVSVTAAGTILRNMVINGNLTIAEEVGNGNVTLNNVTVKGETFVNGGGANSIIVIDSTLGEVTVTKVDGKIRIVISGNTSVSLLNANSGCTLEESNLSGGSKGFTEIIIDADSEDTIILNGSFDKVTINSDDVEVQVPKSTKIGTLVVNASADITGTGTITRAEINANGVSFEKSPNVIVTAAGISAPKIEGLIPGGGGGGGGGPRNCTIPETASYDKYGGTTLNIEMSLIGDATLVGITDGTPLTTPAQYVVSNNIATLTQAYMQSLPVGQTTLTFSFSVGQDDTIVITVIDSLQVAIDAATGELGKVAAALAAYTDAGGLSADAVYTDVTDAKTALEGAIAADPQVKADIQSKTATLTSKLDALEDATEALIEAALLADAIEAANTEIGKVAAAQAQYVYYGGITTDAVYTDVTTAKTTLEAALAADPKVRATIENATAALTSKITALKNATDVLIGLLNDAAQAANTELGKVAAAQSAYIAAGGLTGDTVYTDVTSAESALESALDADPQVRTTIISLTTTLTAKLSALDAATNALIEALNNAISAANTEIGKVAAAQASYIYYNGLNTDAVYTDVTGAKTALEGVIAATPQVTADIISATIALTEKLEALDDATDVLIGALINSINAANTELSKVSQALERYTSNGGLNTAAVYTDVTNAKSTLEAALGATPKVTSDIISATTTLTAKLNALDDATDALIEAALLAEAINEANTYIGYVNPSLLMYTDAGGLTTDTVYTDLTDAKIALEEALAAVPQVRGNIESLTLALSGKLDAIHAATDALIEAALLADAIEAANTEIGKVAAALTAYIEAEGLESDLVYTDVTTAKSALEAAISASPQVRATIESLTTALTDKLSALNAAKNVLIGLLNDAIIAANNEIDKVAAAQTAYTNAGGLIIDTVYTDVTDAMSALNAKLMATPKVRTEIINATTALTSKLNLLNIATTALLASLQEAIEAANVELGKVTAWKIAYIEAGGKTTDAVYADVSSAQAALEGAIAAEPQVKATIVSLTAALTGKLNALNAATEALIEAELLALAIDAANTELGKVAAAQTAYTDAGGLVSDTVYTDVTSAKSALEAAIAADPQVRATIESLTMELFGKLNALDDATYAIIDATLLAAAEGAVSALEDAADEDLLVEANLIAAEALVGPAEAAVSAARGITGINAIEARLTTSKAIVEDAREYFDSVTIVLLTDLGTHSVFTTVKPGEVYAVYDDSTLANYQVIIKLSMVDSSITTGATAYKIKVGDTLYTMHVNPMNADIILVTIPYSLDLTFDDIKGATFIVEY